MMNTNMSDDPRDHRDDDHNEPSGLPASPSTIELDGVSRRTFLAVAGAGAALAGASLSGCIRKPVTKLVPYATRPEDLVEGVALHFASAYQEGAAVTGIVVESHEGRPTKIAGNKAHPDSLGATRATTQASVLGLYDLDRSTVPHGPDNATLSWDAAWSAFDRLAAAAKAKPIAIVLPAVMSPTARRLLVEAKSALPQARLFRADFVWPHNAMAAAQALGGAGAYAQSHLELAEVVAAFDSDFLCADPDSVRMTKGFTQKRQVTGPNQPMNRLYVVEPGFSSTGAMADHRARVKAGDVGKALALLARKLGDNGVAVDPAIAGVLPQVTLDPKADKLIAVLAKDLAAHRGAAFVSVGPRQPSWVHALGFAINAALGGKTETWHNDPNLPAMEGLDALAQAAKDFTAIFVIDTNPAYTSSGALGLAAALAGANVVHAGTHNDETGKGSKLHLPISHYLESWGDLQSLGGAASVVQPLIDPLHHTPSALEVLARLVRGKGVGGYELVRETWKLDEATWETWLHDGVRAVEVAAGQANFANAVPLVQAGSAAQTAATEIAFELDSNLLDGRFANNGWMRELPHPMSKVTWDNTALMNQKTAGELRTGALIALTVDGKTANVALHILPGVADGVIIVSLGGGRKAGGKVAEQHGFDLYPILPVTLETVGWFAAGSFAATGDEVKLANVQTSGNSLTPQAVDGFGPTASPSTLLPKQKAGAHGAHGAEHAEPAAPEAAHGVDHGKNKGRFEPRMIALQATLAEYAETPDFPDKISDRVFPDEKVKSWMYPERPNEKPLPGGATSDDLYLNGVHQWGMSIDLNTCTGCNACTVACNAENNIVVVGKDQVLVGREMHWIRLDRYFSGTEDEVEAIIQPLPCQQCETAPCEAVCPVKATAHSNEGLNDMVYNRCVGTRYCANNCPFKVRRFNWFNFNLDLHPLDQMQKNPDVTIRFRGVMEKCTYCVQRINRAKIKAKIHGNGQVPDGAIEVACAEVCPANAIIFGDLRDPNSAVVKAKSEPRTYQLLRELNMRARTTYLAKLKNPNPDLV